MSNPSGYLADLYKLDGKVAVVIGGVALALATKREGPWVLVAADVVFTLVLLIALWRALGRKR